MKMLCFVQKHAFKTCFSSVFDVWRANSEFRMRFGSVFWVRNAKSEFHSENGKNKRSTTSTTAARQQHDSSTTAARPARQQHDSSTTHPEHAESKKWRRNWNTRVGTPFLIKYEPNLWFRVVLHWFWWKIKKNICFQWFRVNLWWKCMKSIDLQYFWLILWENVIKPLVLWENVGKRKESGRKRAETWGIQAFTLAT